MCVSPQIGERNETIGKSDPVSGLAIDPTARVQQLQRFLLADDLGQCCRQPEAVMKTEAGELAIASYPSRAKVKNAKVDAAVSVLVMGESFHDEWIQIDGMARVFDMPEAADGLVAYFRCISGEHPDWDEYRQAMTEQNKSVLLIDITRWSPASRGGFPPELFED